LLVPVIFGAKYVAKPAFTVAVAGETVRVTGFVVMVMTADPLTDGSLARVALIVAVPPLGTLSGAT